MLNFYQKGFKLVGFEPAKNIKHIDVGKNVKIFQDYFNANNFNENFDKKAKIITSCAIFYDLEDPNKLFDNSDKTSSKRNAIEPDAVSTVSTRDDISTCKAFVCSIWVCNAR